MQIQLATPGSRQGRSKSQAAETMVQEYLRRAQPLIPVELLAVDSEAALVAASERTRGSSARPSATLVLFDSRGELLSSLEFAALIRRHRDNGTQRLLFAVGPADGWAGEMLKRADTIVSFGRMTLPHELARVVAAEQIYRALTILAGHPYHCGH